MLNLLTRKTIGSVWAGADHRVLWGPEVRAVLGSDSSCTAARGAALCQRSGPRPPDCRRYTSIWKAAAGSRMASRPTLEGTEDRDDRRLGSTSFSVSDRSRECECDRVSENRDGGWMRSLKL